MVDIHCHILPGVDDGSPSMEDSLQMARMAADSGVTDIIATPHCNLPGDGPKNYRSASLRTGFSRLRQALEQEGIPLGIHPGAEVFCTPELPELLDRRQLQTLGGGRYLLVEFYFDESAEFMEQCFHQIRTRGLTPVAAHPERYDAVQRDPYIIRRWFEGGVVIQLNKGSILGRLGPGHGPVAAGAGAGPRRRQRRPPAHRPHHPYGAAAPHPGRGFFPRLPPAAAGGEPPPYFRGPPPGGDGRAYFFPKGGRAMRAIRKMQRVILALFILTLLAFCGLRIYRRLTVDVTPPVITCSTDSIDVSVTAGEEALLQGVMASDDRDGDLTDQILIKGVSPSLTDSSAQVTYIVFDSANNMATVTRTVRYTDYEAPRFALSQPLVYPAGQTVTLLDRLTATDVLDGDISSGIRITSQNVINSQPGVYSVTAQVDSRLGNSVVLPLKVVITAGGPQLITLSDYLVYLPRGSAFDAAGYIQSVTAPDGTALPAGQVSIESPVDTSVPGTYHVGYSVTAQGQSYTVYLAVVVE